jgi:hypothetical protein
MNTLSLPGSSWSNPIWHGCWRIYMSFDGWGEFAWAYSHDDYDGAEDARDSRAGYAPSAAACMSEIDERFP